MVGFLGAAPLHAVFFDWVTFGEPEVVRFVWWIAIAGTLAAVGGIVGGWLMYGHRKERDPLRAMGPMWNVLENRYYIDAFYMSAIVYPIRDKLSAAVYWFNQTILDGIVNAAGMLARGLAQIVNLFDHDVIDGTVNGLANTAGFSGGLLKYIQSGNVQRYMAFLFVGVLVLAVVFARVV